MGLSIIGGGAGSSGGGGGGGGSAYMGDFDLTASYAKGSIVQHNGKSFVATTDGITGVEPTQLPASLKGPQFSTGHYHDDFSQDPRSIVTDGLAWSDPDVAGATIAPATDVAAMGDTSLVTTPITSYLKFTGSGEAYGKQTITLNVTTTEPGTISFAMTFDGNTSNAEIDFNLDNGTKTQYNWGASSRNLWQEYSYDLPAGDHVIKFIYWDGNTAATDVGMNSAGIANLDITGFVVPGGWDMLGVTDAESMGFTPAGNLASKTVEDALKELDTEKAGAAHTHPRSLIVIEDGAAVPAGTPAGTVVMRKAPVYFDPTQISGLVTWLSADKLVADGVADGAEVLSWADLSGLGHAATGTTGKAPHLAATAGKNGGPAVNFVPNSGNQWLTLPVGPTGLDAEVFGSLRGNQTSGGHWQFSSAYDGADTIVQGQMWSGTQYIREAFGGASRADASAKNYNYPNNYLYREIQQSSTSMNTESWTSYNVFRDAPANYAPGYDKKVLWDWYANGLELGNTNNPYYLDQVNPAWATKPVIGAAYLNGLGGFSGWFGAVILYDRKLTADERAKVNQFLADNPSGGTIRTVPAPPAQPTIQLWDGTALQSMY